MRASGMLLPIASLPSKYGIGTFSKSAYDFVDILKAAGQKFWQILPLGPTGYGDSPYQSFSTYAGNPYFIDLDQLVEEGLLSEKECKSFDFGTNRRHIDYGKIYDSRFLLLRKAYEHCELEGNQDYQKFLAENEEWLDDYCLYMAVKNHFDGVSWDHWDEDIRLRKPEAMEKYRNLYEDEINFFRFQQFKFQEQWYALKKYANQSGVEIIGDIPIYVAFDSADTWARPDLFQFDDENLPIDVAGCPPDGFSATGQLWGNPLYKWEYHKETGYVWWAKRMERCFRLYDIVRVDHFRGFDEYYAIPYGNKTAENGCWKKGPGLDLFRQLMKQLGEMRVIAEDLGYLTPSVIQMVEESGFPGMKVLEFAFDSREPSNYLPHNYDKNCVVYTGTHDNQTLRTWYYEMAEEDRELAKEYMNLYGRSDEEIHWEFIRLALSSVAMLAVIPVQDYLYLNSDARINTPSTLGDNWTWRLTDEDFDEGLISKIRKLCVLYGRSE